MRILAAHLTIGETYFFREKTSFQLLEDRILPQLIEARERGWPADPPLEAGCCTGEEAYSLAICLARLLPDPRGWDISILATDINEHFLHKARAAIYGEWSFRKPRRKSSPVASLERRKDDTMCFRAFDAMSVSRRSISPKMSTRLR